MSAESIQSSRQQGVVLFIALVALLVMSLAAVALIRSVDTNTVIAGNLALKQSALVSSDRGVEAALEWIDAKIVANAASLDSNIVAEGYFATFDVNGDGVIEDDEDDPDNAKKLVDDSGILETANDGQGNAVRYVVQRMCLEAIPPTADKCMFGDAEIGTGSRGVKDATEAGAKIDAQQSPMYRITVKVTGPKNTVSYTQTFVY